MADTFDRLKSKFNKGVVTVSSKTTSTIEKTKIKTRISTVQNDIELIYGSLGEMVYKMWLNNDHNFNYFDEKCNMIKAKQDEIEKLNEEIRVVEEKEKQAIDAAEAEVENMDNASCNQTYNAGCACDTNAGNAQSCNINAEGCAENAGEANNAAQSGFKMFCTNCGKEFDHPVKFCNACGTKLGE